MIWFLIVLLIFAGMFIPLRVTADIHHGARRLMRLHISTAGFRGEWVAEAVRGQEGHQLLVARRGRKPRTLSPASLHVGAAESLTSMLRESRPARRFLMKHVHAEQLDIQLLLHTASAASTALMTGAVQLAVQLLPAHWRGKLRLRILPDFLRDRSTLQARCIFRLCMGTLLITAGLLLASHVAQAINKEAHLIWNTPSEN